MSDLGNFDFYGLRPSDENRIRNPDIYGYRLMCELEEDVRPDMSVRNVDVYGRIDTKLMLWFSVG